MAFNVVLYALYLVCHQSWIEGERLLGTGPIGGSPDDGWTKESRQSRCVIVHVRLFAPIRIKHAVYILPMMARKVHSKAVYYIAQLNASCMVVWPDWQVCRRHHHNADDDDDAAWHEGTKARQWFYCQRFHTINLARARNTLHKQHRIIKYTTYNIKYDE